MKYKQISNFLKAEMDRLCPRWDVEMGLTIFGGGGGLFVLEKYDRFYASTKQSLATGVNIYEQVALYHSGDGYRAFLWLESYIQLISTKKFIPSFIDIVCERRYQKELRKTFGPFYNISEDSILLKELGKAQEEKDNATYILQSLQELKGLMSVNGKLFREITRNDMELKA
ncbi:hypothetical protein [Bacillus cereus]|uniref:hypothetical protein n=1 Tax=Bacillus cereus TaxID=1396 RepID=UPI000BEE7286|nr:hypothetical protein [Bacillus cereus]PEE32523.1 hypothetical protein CON59_30565 [Bacillus cereus]PET36005.1 hypothetical protein CN523_30330 [Bacillus cereus]PEV82607.1 hypothetical protein CN429_13705 [Bacillus cereus]PFA47042.1 hypothetical protein CN389_26340 [Bacillus cereus]PFD55646.1 hypothetical protein CN271_31295 [Bacillus cereus]